MKGSACLVVLEKRIVGGGDKKTQMVWLSSVVYLTEEEVCMLTVRGAKKIAKKTHTPAKGKRGD
jgi:hypothetical protein